MISLKPTIFSMRFLALIAAILYPSPALSQMIPPPPKNAKDTFAPDAKAPFLEFSRDWPGRWVPAESKDRGIIVPVSAPASTLAVRFVRDSLQKREIDESDFQALLSRFPSSPNDTAPTLSWKIEGFNATPVESSRPVPKFLRCGEPDASLVFRFVSATLSNESPPVATLERTTFALYETANGLPTHLVLLLPGMFGTPQEILEPLIANLRSSNIAVLRLFAHPSRFTEEISVSVNPGDPHALRAQAVDIAARVNSRLAECAYAVDAAVNYVCSQRPPLRSVPLIACGGSGGAIVTPTVCALNPTRWAGVIMVGSGADFWLINQRSNYQNLIRALRVNWTADPTLEQRQEFDSIYIEHATLDSFHTAKALADIPVLLIQGENDQAVPAALGDLLWQRLQPRQSPSRRIASPLTHEALFATLPARFDELTDWIKARK